MKLNPDIIAKWRQQGNDRPDCRHLIGTEEWKQLCDLALIGWYNAQPTKEIKS